MLMFKSIEGGLPVLREEVVNESSDLMRSFKDIENYINEEITTSPFEGSPVSYKGVNIKIGVEDKNNFNDCFTIIIDDMKHEVDRNSLAYLTYSVKVKSGIAPIDFTATVTQKPGREGSVATLDSIRDKCDNDALFTAGFAGARRNIERIVPIYMIALNELELRRRSVDTLAVFWDEAVSNYVMLYNPAFITWSAVIEYVRDLYKEGGRRAFKNFEDAYVYTLTFVICHELEHIIRQNTKGKDGTLVTNLDNDPSSHRFSNGLLDIFINVNIQSWLNKALDMPSDTRLTVGYGNEFFTVSAPLHKERKGETKGIYSVIPRGLGSFKTVSGLVKAITGSFEKTVSSSDGDRIQDQMKGGGDLTKSLKEYESANIMLMAGCGNINEIFGSNSTLFNNFFVDVVRNITKPIHVEAPKIVKVDPPKQEKPTVEKPTVEKSIVGQAVKDKNTGKIGIVVDYNAVDRKAVIKWLEDTVDIEMLKGILNRQSI